MDASVTELPTRHDRRRERTRGRLLAAARTLITEKGVPGLRINEITEEADVALGSFYNHFESKEQLVEAVVAESLEELARAVVSRTADDDPAVTVSTALRRFIRLAYDAPDFAALVVHLGHVDKVFAASTEESAQAALERGIAAGRFEIGDLEVARTAISFGSLAIIRAVVDGEHRGPDADVAYAELALRAIGVPAVEAQEIARRPLADLA